MPWLTEQLMDTSSQAFNSVVLIICYFLARSVLVFTVRRWQAPTPEEKRRWIVHVKNLSIVILLAGLVGIWATELRTFAISLVAVAAAVAISTKEIIQCFLGGVYKASVHPFDFGDRIEVAGYRGEVIDHNFLSTKLLEIGPWKDVHSLSGRQLVIPNSLFLLHPIINQSLQQEFVLHMIPVPLLPGEDWQMMEKMLLDVALRECESYLEDARRSMQRMGQREGLDLPTVEPRVTFQMGEFGQMQANLRVPCRGSRISKTEQAIVRAILERRRSQGGAPPAPTSTL